MRPYHFDFDQTQTRRARAIAMARPIAWHQPPPFLQPPRGGPHGLWGKAVALIRLWRRRSRERAELARLDLRQLRDIGVNPCEADIECSKPFWRA